MWEQDVSSQALQREGRAMLLLQRIERGWWGRREGNIRNIVEGYTT